MSQARLKSSKEHCQSCSFFRRLNFSLLVLYFSSFSLFSGTHKRNKRCCFFCCSTHTREYMKFSALQITEPPFYSYCSAAQLFKKVLAAYENCHYSVHKSPHLLPLLLLYSFACNKCLPAATKMRKGVCRQFHTYIHTTAEAAL